MQTPLKDLVVQPLFKHLTNLPTFPDLYVALNPTNPKPPDCLLVVRDVELVKLIEELRHVLNDTCIPTKGYHGQYLDMPIIDLEAMLEYVCSDLDKIVGGERSPASAARHYVITEIIDHDAEFSPLLEGVVTIMTRVLQICVDHILSSAFDHYVPHQYELQRVLPSGGLVLRRTDL